MQVSANTDRPPYVQFETRAVENRGKSRELGVYSADDVNFAIITPQGSKDRIERNADEWLEQLDGEVRNQTGRWPPQWVEAYHSAYDAFKRGVAAPLNGTSVKNWPVASPSQVKTCLAAGCLTVEDIASANEPMLRLLGMGSRALKDSAIAWLATKDQAKYAEEMTQLRAENQILKDQSASQSALFEQMVDRLAVLEAKQEAPSTKK